MLDRHIGSIIYQAYIRLGELAYEVTLNSNDGLDSTKDQKVLWAKAIYLSSLLDTIEEHVEIVNSVVYRIINITIPEMNSILSCIKEVSGIYDFPIAPFLPNNTSSVFVGTSFKGDKGDKGDKGSKGDIGLGTDFQAVLYSTNPVDSFTLSDSNAAEWKYYVEEVGGAQRASHIIAHWKSDGSNVALSDGIGAPDLGSTLGIEFDVTIVASTVRLVAVITSGIWLIKGTRFYIPNNGNGAGPVSSVLPNGKLFLGNSSNLAQAQTMSGVLSITNTGVTSFIPGSIVNADIAIGAAISLSKLAPLAFNKLLLSDGAGKIIVSGISNVEAGYLSGANSNLQVQITGKLTDPMTTIGDIIIRNGFNISSRLSIGTTGQVLTVIGGLPQWNNPTTGLIDPMTAPGDMLIRNGSNVTSRFPVSTDGKALLLSGGLPSWQTISQLTVTGGTKYAVSALFNSNSYSLGTTITSGTESGNIGIVYSSVSFTTPAESIWKVSLAFMFQIKGDGGGVESIRFSIERSLDNVSWGTIVTDSQGVASTDNGQHTYIVASGIDVSTTVNTVYYYRLVAANVVGINNYFSNSNGYKLHLIPG